MLYLYSPSFYIFLISGIAWSGKLTLFDRDRGTRFLSLVIGPPGGNKRNWSDLSSHVLPLAIPCGLCWHSHVRNQAAECGRPAFESKCCALYSFAALHPDGPIVARRSWPSFEDGASG